MNKYMPVSVPLSTCLRVVICASPPGTPPAQISKHRQFQSHHLRCWGPGSGQHSLPANPPTPYTLHPTPYTLHPAPYTLHSKTLCRPCGPAGVRLRCETVRGAGQTIRILKYLKLLETWEPRNVSHKLKLLSAIK